MHTRRNGIFLAALLAVALVPVAAHAYLFALIGAGSVLLTMVIGGLAAAASFIFLLFYNLRRRMKKPGDAETVEEDVEEL